jgi:hypothetical protein
MSRTFCVVALGMLFGLVACNGSQPVNTLPSAQEPSATSSLHKMPASCIPTGPLMWMGSGTASTTKRLDGWDSCGVNEWAIHGSNTEIANVVATSTDPATGYTYVGTGSASSHPLVLIFSRLQNGNIAPYETLGSTSFNCGTSDCPLVPYLDENSNIWVGTFLCSASCSNTPLLRFSPNANGTSVTPASKIYSTCGSPNGWLKIGGDGNGHIYAAASNAVTNPSPFSIQEFHETDNGASVTPINCLIGSHIAPDTPEGVAIGHNGKLYVANFGFQGGSGSGSNPGYIQIWNAGDSGNTAPEHEIAGPLTTIAHPVGIAISGSNDNYSIYVANFVDYTTSNILKFAAGTTGNTAPIASYSVRAGIEGFSICPAVVIGSGVAECSTVPSAKKHKHLAEER